jgi:hypothetical protein
MEVYKREIIPVANPYSSKGLIKIAVQKKIMGVDNNHMVPDIILFFFFLPDNLNTMKFNSPITTNKINKKNKIILHTPTIHSVSLRNPTQ